MAQKENQKIDSLLTRFYREEVNNVEIPDSERCWQSLQQKMAKAEREGTISSISDRSGPSVPVPRLGFIKKYRNLTALAAACLLVVMVLSGMPPAQNLRQILTGSQPRMDSDAPMIMGTKETEEEPMIMLEKSPSQPPHPEPPPAGEEVAPRDSFARPEGAGMNDITQFSILADTLELTFDNLEQYSNALHENRELVRGKLLYLAESPEGYNFEQGLIMKEDTNLLEIRQEFTGITGEQLIIQQIFTVDPAIMADEPTGEPVYDFQTYAGINTLQHSRADSTILLTGNLDQEGLSAIFEKLTPLD